MFTLEGPRRTGHYMVYGTLDRAGFPSIGCVSCNIRRLADNATSARKTRPDLCDGTYDQFCHMTPHFNNITAILEHHGQHELIRFMNRYWLASE